MWTRILGARVPSLTLTLGADDIDSMDLAMEIRGSDAAMTLDRRRTVEREKMCCRSKTKSTSFLRHALYYI